MKKSLNTTNNFDQYFTVLMIAQILKLSKWAVYKRIKNLEIYPVGIDGQKKYYHHSAIEYVKNNEPNNKYLIFQSKINNN